MIVLLLEVPLQELEEFLVLGVVLLHAVWEESQVFA
jgi:hypothetical protein